MCEQPKVEPCGCCGSYTSLRNEHDQPLCGDCKREAQPGPISSHSRVRCPGCTHHWQPLCGGLVQGVVALALSCPSCGLDFGVSVRAVPLYEVPALLTEETTP